MKNISSWIKRHAASTALIGILSGFSAHAAADAYNIILKQGGSPLACATGGFNFTKTAVGTFPTSNRLITVASGCISGLPASSFNSGDLQVVVENVMLNAQAQGANVTGLRESLRTPASGVGANQVYYRIVFYKTGTSSAPIRTYKIRKIMGTVALGQTSTAVSEGTYHVQNVNAVPEPESLLLLLAGAASLFYMRRRKPAGRV